MKNFKKIFSIFALGIFVLTAVISFSSCSSKEQKFKKGIEQANKMLPMKVDQGLTIVKVAMDNGDLVYTCKCDEHLYDMNVLEDNKDEMRKACLQALKSESKKKEFKEIVNYCKENGINIVYNYVGSRTKQNVKVVIDPSEI